jgi:hypothetical protein
VLLIKQYERNLKQLNFIVNQINVIIYSYQHSMKKYLPRFFKFYQPKATGGGFLIFEWTLIYGDRTIISFVGFVANLLNRRHGPKKCVRKRVTFRPLVST